MLTVEEIKSEATKEGLVFLKFVRFDTGEYRYCSIFDEHKSLVAAGETAVAAGTVKLYPNKMVMEDVYSTTLQRGTLPEDETYLEKTFGVPMKSKWD